MSQQLHLNAFLMGVGHHEAAWRHPRTDARNILSVAHFWHTLATKFLTLMRNVPNEITLTYVETGYNQAG